MYVHEQTLRPTQHIEKHIILYKIFLQVDHPQLCNVRSQLWIPLKTRPEHLQNTRNVFLLPAQPRGDEGERHLR